MAYKVNQIDLNRTLRQYCAALGLPYGDDKSTDNKKGSLFFEKPPSNSGGRLYLVTLQKEGTLANGGDKRAFQYRRMTSNQWHSVLMITIDAWLFAEELQERYHKWNDTLGRWE